MITNKLIANRLLLACKPKCINGTLKSFCPYIRWHRAHQHGPSGWMFNQLWRKQWRQLRQLFAQLFPTPKNTNQCISNTIADSTKVTDI